MGFSHLPCRSDYRIQKHFKCLNFKVTSLMRKDVTHETMEDPFLVKDMQTPPLKGSRHHFLVRSVALCPETNDKSIFRFIVFVI